jgi:hypothetical protein
MRPLKRKEFGKNEKNTSQNNVRPDLRWRLLEAFGEYCSYCEMPIGQLEIEHHKLHKKWGKTLERKDWKHLLLICHDCRRHLNREKLNVTDLSSYLWPDTDLTFSLHPDHTPFLYEKILIEYKIADGRKVHSTEEKYFVTVRANPKLKLSIYKKAQKTIDLFQLNTRPFFTKQSHGLNPPKRSQANG